MFWTRSRSDMDSNLIFGEIKKGISTPGIGLALDNKRDHGRSKWTRKRCL